MNLDIELEIEAKAVAPRVTAADVEAAIASEHYFTAAQGVMGAGGLPLRDSAQLLPLHLVTFCVLVLHNGYTLTGHSACASPENYDVDIGRKIARSDAVRQVWPLLGYQLREHLHRTAVLDALPKNPTHEPLPLWAAGM